MPRIHANDRGLIHAIGRGKVARRLASGEPLHDFTALMRQLWLAAEDLAPLCLSSNKLAAVRNTSIGFVFQQFNLLARATALENVELPMVYAGLGWRERRRRAHKALMQVGLSEREHHRPSQLSGGQQQRVAIARALVNQPLLLLADEPTGALDSVTSDEIMAALVRLNEGWLTVIVVTHDAEVARYARRVIQFKDGRE